MNRFLPLFALCLLPSSEAADPERVLAVRHIGVDQGLSQSHVTSFVQDQRGFVWIGTAVGLNRFDGLQFQTFLHHEDVATTISSDIIYALHVDKSGGVWVGTDRGLDRFEPATGSFHRFGEQVFTNRRQRRGVRAIHSDARGRLWLATNEPDSAFSQLVRFDPSTRQVWRYPIPLGKDESLVAVHAKADRAVLFVTSDSRARSHPHGFAAGILDPENGSIAQVHVAASPAAAHPVTVGERDVSFAPAGHESFWIGGPGHQIFRWDFAKGRLEPRVYDPELAKDRPADLVSRVFPGVNGELIVVPTSRRPKRRPGGGNIYVLAGTGELLRKSMLRPAGPCDFMRSFAISGMVDRTGVMWTGISGSGMCAADLESGVFSHIHESSPDIALGSNFVRSVWKTRDGVLWVGTRNGVSRIDRSRSTSRLIAHRASQPRSLSDDEVRAVLVDRSRALWVGTQAGGLNRSLDEGRTFQHFRHNPADPTSIGSDHINAFLEDQSGDLWIATGQGGLNRFQPADDTFASFRHTPGNSSSIGSDNVTSLLEDSSGNFWVGTEDAGLYRFDRQSGRFFKVNFEFADAPNIVSLAEGHLTGNAIWIATLRHGLIRYDFRSGRYKRLDANNSLLPSSTVYSVLSDEQGFIWAGTNQGLVRIDPSDDSFRIFGMDQGLQSMEFNTRACFRAHDGELLLGGIGGLNAFYPATITQNVAPPSVVITAVRTIDPRNSDGNGLYRTVYRDGGTPGLDRLPAGNREVVFRYVGLHYADPARNRYRVKLEGFDETWRDMGVLREAVYTNLSPGPYRFLVEAVTSRGVWSSRPAAYSFTIARPLYSRPWFVAIAILGVFSAGFLAQRYRVIRLRAAKCALEANVQERTLELSKALKTISEQADCLKEAHALQSRFITNVSHDFRTPLAITLGTLTDIRSGFYGPVRAELDQHLETVMRNERLLLRLVNQMLAIAQIESGRLRLEVSECDLTALVREIIATIRPAADRKGVTFKLGAAELVLVYCDPEWAGQAITNLIVNALKFTPPGGGIEVAVRVDAATRQCVVSVRDSGPGISPEDVPRIFDRFFQSERETYGSSAGIGVGLSLAKEIVDLHHGQLSVSSVPGAGATFQIAFLPGYDHFESSQLSRAGPVLPSDRGLESLASDLLWDASEPGPIADDSLDKPVLVVAEDDSELRGYLCRHLAGEYRVLAASSGDAAWNLIRSEIPDLVVSDVMMPGMDGYQLCREMKSGPETDFIPLVLLTAKVQTADRIEGLECGADDYIAKPFEMQELLARVRNILEGRDRLRTRLAAEISLAAAVSRDAIPPSDDNVFLNRVYETIRRHAQDPEFSIEQMAKELAMSRMHLYRRLGTVLGKSPTDLLMEYRLERAAVLLAAQSGTVSEIAYGLGFKNVSHFTRRFRTRFGHTPSAHRNADHTIDHSAAI